MAEGSCQYRQDAAPVTADRESNSKRRGLAISDLLNPPSEQHVISASPSISVVSIKVEDDEINTPPSASNQVPYRLNQQPLRRQSCSSAQSVSSRSSLESCLSHGRQSSRSSTSPGPQSDTQTDPRPFRPPYKEEESDFLWFYQIDLRASWKETNVAFERTFGTKMRDQSGLQCKFYRVIEGQGVPKVRQLKKNYEDWGQFGMWQRRRIRYPWMKEFASKLPGFWPPDNSRKLTAVKMAGNERLPKL
ncbi:uncharacterized protein KY384_003198 [Bacidia gigantensis]|uniref:uncharacterized protein n=1 Tax=Bacidia gigantensis TaxID=2732470 RepID=UPI001D043D75|nr:uncharacterized protein KY384_003198 [Bacidia gigantensis]KAG8531568.1 hypothetical protein KY384_003198 [Bacidia gigantensis]